MTDITVKLHSIETDGLPDMDNLCGRVAFIWDGNLISGWPLEDEGEYPGEVWEPSDDAMGKQYWGVEYWIELPAPLWNLHKMQQAPAEPA